MDFRKGNPIFTRMGENQVISINLGESLEGSGFSKVNIIERGADTPTIYATGFNSFNFDENVAYTDLNLRDSMNFILLLVKIILHLKRILLKLRLFLILKNMLGLMIVLLLLLRVLRSGNFINLLMLVWIRVRLCMMIGNMLLLIQGLLFWIREK